MKNHKAMQKNAGARKQSFGKAALSQDKTEKDKSEKADRAQGQGKVAPTLDR